VNCLAHAHLLTVTLTYGRVLDWLSHPFSVYFWTLASAIEIGSYSGIVLA
jgi:hypothetical protein